MWWPLAQWRAESTSISETDVSPAVRMASGGSLNRSSACCSQAEVYSISCAVGSRLPSYSGSQAGLIASGRVMLYSAGFSTPVRAASHSSIKSVAFRPAFSIRTTPGIPSSSMASLSTARHWAQVRRNPSVESSMVIAVFSPRSGEGRNRVPRGSCDRGPRHVRRASSVGATGSLSRATSSGLSRATSSGLYGLP